MRSSTGWMLGLLVAVVATAGRAEDEEPPEPTTPLARVVTVMRAEDGKPFAGVLVEALGAPGGKQTKTTGDDGTVRFDAMPRKGVTFVARHDGRYPAWHEPGAWWWHMPEEDRDPDGDGVTAIRLGLFAGSPFEGRVVAKAGAAPIRGATVEAWERQTATDQIYLDAARIWTATSGADGRFRTSSGRPADLRSPHVEVRVTARAPGFISETIVGDDSPVTFALLPAATLSGIVTGADGKPAAGVAVHAYPADFGAFASEGSQEVRRHDEDEHPRVLHVVTGADGRYTMPELHPGVTFHVYAERESQPAGDAYEPLRAVERSEVVPGVTVAKTGGAAGCDLVLRALSTLAVEVAADAGGDSEPRISLDPPARTRPWLYDDPTERGRSWRELDPGRYVLHVEADGWAPLTKTIEIPPGRDVRETIRLDRGLAIEGSVVDDRGEPVPGVHVSADPAGPSAPTGRGSGRALTDAIGRFRISGLAAGTVELNVWGDDHFLDEKVRATVPSAETRLTVIREPRIRVRVDAPPGDALPPKVRVVVVPLSGHYAGMRDERIVPTAELPAVLDRVRPGPLEVVVDVPGHAPATIRVEPKPGETVDAGAFRFERGVDVAGRVIGAEGAPVRGARVTPYENDARTVTTGEGGTFVLPHLAPGPVDLSVRAEGFPDVLLTASAGSLADAAPVPLGIVLRRGGVVHVTVRANDGERIEDRRFCIFPASAPHGYVPHWHLDGKDRTLRLPAGKYRYVPSRYEFDRGAIVFEVTEGGETAVEFAIP